jgi:hypothetical protein
MIAFWTMGDCRLARDEEATYRRMAHHLGAANRCRRRLRLTGSSVTNGAEAILDDRLRIVHAEGDAREKEAQVELVAVANARSQAKTASLTALKMWPALTEARWTLLRRAAIKMGALSRRALQAHPDVCRVRTGGSA